MWINLNLKYINNKFINPKVLKDKYVTCNN